MSNRICHDDVDKPSEISGRKDIEIEEKKRKSCQRLGCHVEYLCYEKPLDTGQTMKSVAFECSHLEDQCDVVEWDCPYVFAQSFPEHLVGISNGKRADHHKKHILR